jgi:hypothetical protein
MRYRKLTATGDYVFGNGQLDFYRDVPEAPGQAVKTRLQLWLGEWFPNIDSGTPYPIGVLGKHSKAQADAVIQDRAQNTQGVADNGISNYESSINPDTRKMDVRFSVDTIYGPTQVQIENYSNY